MREIWKVVEGYEAYEVSNLGEVRNADTKILKKKSFQKTWHFTPVVSLNRGKRNTRQYSVARLVAEAFIGPRPEGMRLVYLDKTVKNCEVTNLKYVTHQEWRDNYRINNWGELKKKKKNVKKHKLLSSREYSFNMQDALREVMALP